MAMNKEPRAAAKLPTKQLAILGKEDEKRLSPFLVFVLSVESKCSSWSGKDLHRHVSLDIIDYK